MKKSAILLLLLSCILCANELADALRGWKSQIPEEKNVITKKHSAERKSCDKTTVNMVADNNTSFFREQKEKLMELNNCLINNDMTPTMLAAYIDRPNILKIFLDADINANDRSAKDYTALHFAAFYGNYEAAQMLITKGVDINAQNDAGQTALMIAANYGNAKTVKLLLSKGADVMIRDRAGYTAKELAAKNKRKEALAVFGK